MGVFSGFFLLFCFVLFFIPPLPEGGAGYTVLPLSFRPSKIFFVAFFSVTVNGKNLIFCHKLHIGIPYFGQHFWTRQIHTSCLPTQLFFIHIEHICTFFVTFFSATLDGKNLLFGHKLHIGMSYCGKRFWTHQIPTSCLPTLLIFIHLNIYAHFSSHFSQQLLMTEISYLVTSFIQVPHIVGSVFGPIRFLLPLCRFC